MSSAHTRIPSVGRHPRRATPATLTGVSGHPKTAWVVAITQSRTGPVSIWTKPGYKPTPPMPSEGATYRILDTGTPGMLMCLRGGDLQAAACSR